MKVVKSVAGFLGCYVVMKVVKNAAGFLGCYVGMKVVKNVAGFLVCQYKNVFSTLCMLRSFYTVLHPGLLVFPCFLGIKNTLEKLT